MAMKHVPELVRRNGRWILDGWQPGMSALLWPDFAGKTGTLYVLESAGFVKIGLATNFERRFRNIAYGMPMPVRRVATRTVPLAGLAFAEAWMHSQFAAHRVKGEWFAVDPAAVVQRLQKAVVRAQVYERHCWEYDRDHPY